MSENADSYGYYTPPEQQEANDALYKPLKKLTQRFSGGHTPAGNGYTTSVPSSPSYVASVALEHHRPTGNANEVGRVSWDTATGHVHWMGVQGDHSHMVPKLMSDAKAHADREGYAPPLGSDNMTGDSYRIAKKYAPESIPERASVNERPLNISDVDLHQMKSHINLMHATAIANSEPEYHTRINQHAANARDHLNKLQRVASTITAEKDVDQKYAGHAGDLFHAVGNLGIYLGLKEKQAGYELSNKILGG